MGLLDTFFGSPDQTAALGLLGARMMSGDTARGFGEASGLLYGADERKLKRNLLQAQYDETMAQADERKQKLEMARQSQLRQDRLLFGDPSGVSAGAFAPAADGMGPVMPQGAAPQAGGLLARARGLGMPEDVIQADIAFNGGKKISEFLNSRSTPKWENINGNLVNTNAQGFQGGMQGGMSAGNDGRVTAWQPDGQGGIVVGAPRGALDTFRAYQNVGEGTKANYDPLTIPPRAGQQNPTLTTRGAFVAGQQGGPTNAGEAGMRAQVAGPMGADPEAIKREIQKTVQDLTSKPMDPASRQALEAHVSELSATLRSISGSAPVQTAQGGIALQSEAEKIRTTEEAKAAAARDAAMQKGAVDSKDTMSQITEARRLLKLGPTSSGFGSAVDFAGGLVGLSTKGADVAAQLDTLSGWMVAKVPRMEGPQSNFDVQNYKTMAAVVGDRMKPISQRLAALDTLEGLQQKYAHLNGSGEAKPDSGKALVASLPKTAAAGTRARDTTTGKILKFNGLSWVEEK
jgi:hypothetical protein